MMSLFFHFQHTLNRLFKNYIKLYWHYISSSWNMKGGLTSKIPDLLGLNHGLLLQNVRKRENWIFQLLNYSINELFLKIRNAWCRCVIQGCLKNSIWLIFSYFSNFLLLYWKSKLTYLLVLLWEAFSEFCKKFALRPGLGILLNTN